MATTQSDLEQKELLDRAGDQPYVIEEFGTLLLQDYAELVCVGNQHHDK